MVEHLTFITICVHQNAFLLLMCGLFILGTQLRKEALSWDSNSQVISCYLFWCCSGE